MPSRCSSLPPLKILQAAPGGLLRHADWVAHGAWRVGRRGEGWPQRPGRREVRTTSDSDPAPAVHQAKRANIGIALVSSPKLLLMDEPTTGLDAFNAHSVVEGARRMHAACMWAGGPWHAVRLVLPRATAAPPDTP